MSDYGHHLLFGSFVAPVARPARHAVDIAIASEDAGLDLVSFQDHPYQQSFLDTSTLLTYVASKTRRIAVSANVASLPLRAPLTIARHAATIDRLSGGRFRLGLGAGAFWDGIARLGGRRLTSGQGVDALAEAIPLIRQSLSSPDGGFIEADGTYYRTQAPLGLSARADIPIWVGSYKPRMLALTGALGDGWLPTIEYVEGGLRGVQDANARIDDAARAAGRAPQSVRRLMNVMQVGFGAGRGGLLSGPPATWVEQITELALGYGLSAFIIGGDDPRTIQVLGSEIAPAVREAVNRERATAEATR